MSEDRKDKQITFRLSARLYKELEMDSFVTGATIPELVRWNLTNAYAPEPPEQEQ